MIFDRSPGSDPLGGLRPWGQKVKIHFFSEYGQFAYQIKGDAATCYKNICPQPPPLPLATLGVGSIGQNSTCSKHGHVVYQIRWNHGCSNTVAAADVRAHEYINIVYICIVLSACQ